MAISNEFAQAVLDRNNLRIRIMLKDSLLIDKSFRLFDEMLEYTLDYGINIWAEPDMPLERSEKPWTEDVMNYELTALINDFTKEHVDYLKEIISDLYKTDIAFSTPSESQIFNRQNPYTTILEETRNISLILKNSKDSVTNKRRWTKGDIDDIKRYAQNIVDACDRIQRRG